MGYDISVRCRTKDLKNRMEKFFKENYRFPFQIFKDKKSMEGDDGLTARGITFAQFYKEHYQDQGMFDNAIGLHYGMVSNRYRLYMHSVLCWMAQAVGRKHYFKNIARACPYIKNDVHGITPIVPQEFKKSVPVTQRRHIVDRIGRIIYSPNREVSRIDLIYIRHEIKRLDFLWKKEQWLIQKPWM